MFNPGAFTSGLGSALSLGGGLTGAAPAASGGGFSLGGFGSAGGFGGIGDLLGNIFGGEDVQEGFEDLQKQIQQGLAGERRGLQQGLGFLHPFQQTGATAAQQELGALGQMKDPTQFVSDILGRFQQSPAQKAAIQSGLEGVQNRLGAQGLGQSGLEQKALEQFAQQQTAGQQQQFLRDVLAAQQQRLGGLGQLGGFGVGAAQTAAQAAAQEAQAEAQLRESLGQTQLAQQKQAGAGLGNILGDIGSIAGIVAML